MPWARTHFSTQARVVSDEFVYVKLAERETSLEYGCMSLYLTTRCYGLESECLLMHVRQFNEFLSIFLSLTGLMCGNSFLCNLNRWTIRPPLKFTRQV